MPFTTIVIPKPQYCLDINKLTNKSEQKLDYHAKNKKNLQQVKKGVKVTTNL